MRFKINRVTRLQDSGICRVQIVTEDGVRGDVEVPDKERLEDIVLALASKVGGRGLTEGTGRAGKLLEAALKR